MTGRRFGRWVVVALASSRSQKRLWLCRCDCGEERVVRGDHLNSGASQSCGCLVPLLMATIKTTHGKCRTSEYRIWESMIARCTKPHVREYRWYGERGIAVCDRWLASFEAFLSDMGERPTGKSLDRYPDNNGNYEPGNCRWATPKEQVYNSRTVMRAVAGYPSLAEAARANGLKVRTVRARLERGWSAEEAVTTTRLYTRVHD